MREREITKKELLDRIPNNKDWQELKEFVSRLSPDNYYLAYNTGTDNLYGIDEICLGNRTYLLKIDFDKRTLQFTDDLVTVTSAENDMPGEKEIYTYWQNELDKLYMNVRQYGAQLIPRGEGNDDYTWADLHISLSKFSIGNLNDLSALWTLHNTKFRRALSFYTNSKEYMPKLLQNRIEKFRYHPDKYKDDKVIQRLYSFDLAKLHKLDIECIIRGYLYTVTDYVKGTRIYITPYSAYFVMLTKPGESVRIYDRQLGDSLQKCLDAIQTYGYHRFLYPFYAAMSLKTPINQFQ